MVLSLMWLFLRPRQSNAFLALQIRGKQRQFQDYSHEDLWPLWEAHSYR